MACLWPGRDGPVIRYISAPPPASWQARERRHLVLLGSTGSIGRSALRVVEANPGAFVVEALACATSVDRLLAQALRHRPPYLAVRTPEAAAQVAALLPPGYAPEILVGEHGYRAIAALPSADTVLSAQAGSAGLAGTLAAALAGKVVCLANKESLVLAGDLLRLVCRETGASILPVDSEHFALFDCLCGRGDDVDHLVLTASGGPFRGKKAADLAQVTPQMALRHPNWNMGAKITVDSATLMNKALELIEACHLYGVGPDQVEVLVHPQSIVHSLVAFRDASMLAQLGVPDMRLPIGACLLWPRVERPLVPALRLAQVGSLTFEEPDREAFPALDLAARALSVRGGMCVVLNAADEAAVELFLAGRCSFPGITAAVAAAMENHLLSLRLHGGDGRQAPYALSRPGAPRGASLAADAWLALDAVEELGARTRRFVYRYLGA